MALNLFKRKAKDSSSDIQVEQVKAPEKKEQKKVRSQEKKKVLLPGSESVLLYPHITEKAALLSEKGQYVFQVNPRSTKHQVRSAVEHLYAIHVERVHMVTTPPKMGRDRKSGREKLTQRLEKKAIVSLKKGEKLELLPRSI